MDGYVSNLKILKLEIVEYNEVDLDIFRSQQPKKSIEGIEFIPSKNGELFHFEKLEPQLSSYTKKYLTKHQSSQYEAFKKETLNAPHKVSGHSGTRAQTEEQEIKLSFSVKFSEAKIILGGVSVNHYVKPLSQDIEFTVMNSHLLPEFDHIKHWFGKKLGSKKIPVDAVVKTKGGEVIEVNAKSNLIKRIDEKLIHGVKVDQTLGLKSKLKTNTIDKSLFTADEFFQSEYDQSNLGNVFGQTDKDLLDIILEISEIRNRKELIYLSGKLHSKNHELRFTNHPHFGFVFYMLGEKEIHFIWELLNSNATYIWSFDKHSGNDERRYQRMEEILNLILESGRENYKGAYRKNIQDQDIKFNFVNHQNKNSNIVDGFPLWKHRIDELMT